MPTEPGIGLGILSDRLQRLIRLDTTVFDEVRDDPAATVPSFLVAVAATLLAGVGGWLWWLVHGFDDGGRVLLMSTFVGSFFSLAFWLLWLAIAWLLLTQFFRQEADWQKMLRTMGMASAPLAMSLGMIIPGIDVGVALASVALYFGLTTIAIQAVTSASPAQVLTANLAGFAVWAIALGLLATSDTPLAPGVFLIDAASEELSEIVGSF